MDAISSFLLLGFEGELFITLGLGAGEEPEPPDEELEGPFACGIFNPTVFFTNCPEHRELLGHGRYPDSKRLPLPTDPVLDTGGLVEEALDTVADVDGRAVGGGAIRTPLPEAPPVPVDPHLSGYIAGLRSDLAMTRAAVQDANSASRLASLEILAMDLEHKLKQMEEEEQYFQALMDL